MLYTFFSVLLGVYIGQEYDVPRVRNIYSNFMSFVEKYGNEFDKTYSKLKNNDNETTNDNYVRSSNESKSDTTNTNTNGDNKESSTWLYDMIKDNFSKKDN